MNRDAGNGGLDREGLAAGVLLYIFGGLFTTRNHLHAIDQWKKKVMLTKKKRLGQREENRKLEFPNEEK